MAIRVLLICHGSTAATRSTAFPLDEPLEPSAVAAAEADGSADRFPAAGTTLSGAALRCRQTAEALGLSASVDTGLGDWDLGAWAGRTLHELADVVPADVQAWLTDPDFIGHGGQALTTLIERVGRWLDEPPGAHPSRLLAVTHPSWIRSAVVHALGAPAQSFWRIDVAPLSVIELRGAPGRWSLYARA